MIYFFNFLFFYELKLYFNRWFFITPFGFGLFCGDCHRWSFFPFFFLWRTKTLFQEMIFHHFHSVGSHFYGDYHNPSISDDGGWFLLLLLLKRNESRVQRGNHQMVDIRWLDRALGALVLLEHQSDYCLVEWKWHVGSMNLITQSSHCSRLVFIDCYWNN
jgi:hypothetical protein